MPPPPNILYLHSHDTGRYVAPYGHAVPTPALQRFAEEGVLFRQAFCVSPTCSPSRAALLTGQYPHQCGMNGLSGPPWNFALNDPGRLLMHHLRAAGYATALVGVQHVTHGTPEGVRSQGFDLLLNEDRLGEDVPDAHERAAAHIRRQAAHGPWFLACGFDQTHRDNRQGDLSSGRSFSQTDPYEVAAVDGRYCLPPAGIPDVADTRRDMASFKEGARRLDLRIGHVLAALADSGQADRTLVIITTDHGIAWPGMKCNLTDRGTAVMLMMRGPGGFSGGKVVDSLVTHLDVFPTICDLLGTSAPAWLEGKSLLPVVRGTGRSIHEAIFSEQCWHEQAEPQRSVRDLRYRYVRRTDPVGPKCENCDESPTKEVMERSGFFDRNQGFEQLFDLYLDPGEACNRIEDPALGEVKQRLRQALDRWMDRTADPLLHRRSVDPPGLDGARQRQARVAELRRAHPPGED